MPFLLHIHTLSCCPHGPPMPGPSDTFKPRWFSLSFVHAIICLTPSYYPNLNEITVKSTLNLLNMLIRKLPNSFTLNLPNTFALNIPDTFISNLPNTVIMNHPNIFTSNLLNTLCCATSRGYFSCQYYLLQTLLLITTEKQFYKCSFI